MPEEEKSCCESAFPTFSKVTNLFPTFYRAGKWLVKKTWKPVIIGALTLNAALGISNKYENKYIMNKPAIAVSKEVSEQYERRVWIRRPPQPPAVVYRGMQWGSNAYERYVSSKNAWRHYENATGLVDKDSSEIIWKYYLQITGGEIPERFRYVEREGKMIREEMQPPTKEEVEKALEKNQPVITELKAGTVCKPEDFQYRRVIPSFSEIFPDYSGMRNLARIAIVDAKIKMEKGKTQEGLEEIVAAVELGNDMEKCPTLIGFLCGVATKYMGEKALHEILTTNKISAEQAKFVAKELERIEKERTNFKNVLGGEYIIIRGGVIKEVFNPQKALPMGAFFGSSSLKEKLWAKFVYSYIKIPWMKAKTLNNFDAYWAEIIKTQDKPYKEAIKVDSFIEKIPWHDPLNRIFFPVYSRVRIAYDKDDVVTKGISTMYALEAYKAEKGVYPEDLNALVETEIINKVPTDPFSEKKVAKVNWPYSSMPDEKQFRYKSFGDNYILYSIGPNMKDDGGEAITMSDSAQDKQGDFVFGKGIDLWGKDPNR